MKKNIEIVFTKKEIYSLVNEDYLIESNVFSSALNKVKLLASKTKIGFNILKDFIKKVYDKFNIIPKFRIVNQILLITIPLNIINTSVVNAERRDNIDNAIELAQNTGGSIVSDGQIFYVLKSGEEGFKSLIKSIKPSENIKSRLPQNASESITINDVTFSNTKELKSSLVNIWDKYISMTNSNEDLQLINIIGKINNEKVNFIFIPNPKNITYEEVLELIKDKGLNLPNDVLENLKNSVGENTGKVNGFIGNPLNEDEYGKISVVVGKHEGAKATLLHESSHLFGIQKEIEKLNYIIDKVIGHIKSYVDNGYPVYIDAIVNKGKVKTDKFGTYILKDYKQGLSKDDLINIIVKKLSSDDNMQERIKKAEWIVSTGLGTGKIKMSNDRSRYVVMPPHSMELDYYLCPEETARYQNSLNDYIEIIKNNKALSSFSKELLTFYKELDVENKIKQKINNIISKKTKTSAGREIFNFRSSLLKSFKKKIKKEFKSNKKLSEKDLKLVEHFFVDVVYFITKYYALNLQSANVDNENIFKANTDLQERLFSLGKLDNVLKKLENNLSETKSYNNQMTNLKEQIYRKLLSFV